MATGPPAVTPGSQRVRRAHRDPTPHARLRSSDGSGRPGAEQNATRTRTATVYRLVTPEHLCPYGLKTIDLLQRHGLEIDDRHLETEEEATELRERLGVDTTPQTFIDGELVGTLDDLREFFGEAVPDEDGETYRPVVTLFAVTFLMALGAASVVEDQWLSVRTFEWFVAFTMCGLGYLKLRDTESFSTMFLNYDLLARRWVRYAYIYPYAETGAGLLMIPAVLNWVSVPVAFVIGTIGAASVQGRLPRRPGAHLCLCRRR
jgi:glutaredoxin